MKKFVSKYIQIQMISLNSSSSFYHSAQILKPSQGLGKELFVTPCRTPYLQWPQHHWLHWLVSQLPPPCHCHWCGVTGKTVVSWWEGFEKVWRLEHFLGNPRFQDISRTETCWRSNLPPILLRPSRQEKMICSRYWRPRAVQGGQGPIIIAWVFIWDLWNFTTLGGGGSGMRDRYFARILVGLSSTF